MRIPTVEFKERLQRMSQAMQAAELDAIIAYGSRVQYGQVRYLTGYEPWVAPEEWAFAVFTPGHRSEITLLSNSPWDFWDFNRAESTWVSDVIVGSRWVESINALLPLTVKLVGIAGWAGFPAPIYLGLTTEFPNTQFVDATQLSRDLRLCKSPAEIEILREAGHIADAGGRALIETTVPGATERQVAAAIDSALTLGGRDQLGYFTILGSGPRTIASCFLPTERRLEQGDVVMVDCAPMLEGYKADFSRLMLAGRGSGRALKLVETIAATFESCREMLRPGVTCAEVAQRGYETVLEHGYTRDNLFASANYPGAVFMGHGIGLENPDPPGMISTTNQTVLCENMVINLEPILLDPDVGGGRIEGSFVITANGPEPLSLCEIRPWQSGT